MYKLATWLKVYSKNVYLPSLMEVIGDMHLDWDNIDKMFLDKYQQRVKLANGGILENVSACVYDIIVEAKKENRSAIIYLNFLNRLFSELSVNISDKERQLIKTNIRNFLTRLDKDYLNYVGEIAVLNNLLNSKLYTLDKVEKKLPNGKSIDFTMKRVSNNSTFLLEIDNIHLKSDKIENDAYKIKSFFNYRYKQKLDEKKVNLNKNIDLTVVHVLWGGWKDLKIYSDYFKNNKNQTDNILEPVAYLSFSNDEGFFANRFGNISNLFNSN